MLSLPDLAGIDPADLAARLQAAALHQDQCRRQAARLKLPEGFEHTAEAIAEMDEHAASIAEGARFAALVARFVADESSGRAAPTRRFVPQPSRAGFLARIVAKLTGAPTRAGAAA
ncbi:hypothetical protein LNAOJCKE_3039 [Methylorubrum aminovorans]|uniref:Uncharacterized protein n=1 Tax=Methylorubrum aminovorans TaxID=269069 RepID=A0ABQ4UGK4_9HYPH|nr:hypothetical protein [Methylorubrum aminovorans]GJE65826.1 hypothetical protein LNAOJCKE_3039 [Methylorubrum aminovorans]GMA75821.1 hypothetical protein GCM10025880_22380 [Methylorubrum aminovorans]